MANEFEQTLEKYINEQEDEYNHKLEKFDYEQEKALQEFKQRQQLERNSFIMDLDQKNLLEFHCIKIICKTTLRRKRKILLIINLPN